jgi:hypothetical protein
VHYIFELSYFLVLMYECSVKSTFFLPHAMSVLISHFAVVILWLFTVHFDVYARSSENYAACKMIHCIAVVCLFIFIIKCLWWIIKIFFFWSSISFFLFIRSFLISIYSTSNFFSNCNPFFFLLLFVKLILID